MKTRCAFERKRVNIHGVTRRMQKFFFFVEISIHFVCHFMCQQQKTSSKRHEIRLRWQQRQVKRYENEKAWRWKSTLRKTMEHSIRRACKLRFTVKPKWIWCRKCEASSSMLCDVASPFLGFRVYTREIKSVFRHTANDYWMLIHSLMNKWRRKTINELMVST